MVKRSVCLYGEELIGIETIFTVINGKQINNPEKLEWLRELSREKKLFCPCGCGINLILVAGDKNIKEQHFRVAQGADKSKCGIDLEGQISVDSKIVLKCWLSDMFSDSEIRSRVSIGSMGNTERKYEISFVVESEKLAVCYSYKRENLAENKLEIIEQVCKDYNAIYIVDISNRCCNNQYPENLMRVQTRQGYCLLLDIESRIYCEAKLKAVFYEKDADGLWQEIEIANGSLQDFSINQNGLLVYKDKSIVELKQKSLNTFKQKIKDSYCSIEFNESTSDDKGTLFSFCKQNNDEKIKPTPEISRLLDNSSKVVVDEYGNRWYRCVRCGKEATENEFMIKGKDAKGTCKECDAKEKAGIAPKVFVNDKPVYRSMKCPKCGCDLVERNGKYGKFLGCSNYPDCTHTENF